MLPLPLPMTAAACLQRLIVVANRLPVSAFKDRAGRWQLQVSAGGLVSALMGVGNFQTTQWIGWPGAEERWGRQHRPLLANAGGIVNWGGWQAWAAWMACVGRALLNAGTPHGTSVLRTA